MKSSSIETILTMAKNTLIHHQNNLYRLKRMAAMTGEHAHYEDPEPPEEVVMNAKLTGTLLDEYNKSQQRICQVVAALQDFRSQGTVCEEFFVSSPVWDFLDQNGDWGIPKNWEKEDPREEVDKDKKHQCCGQCQSQNFVHTEPNGGDARYRYTFPAAQGNWGYIESVTDYKYRCTISEDETILESNDLEGMVGMLKSLGLTEEYRS